jgi:hypothetical protein
MTTVKSYSTTNVQFPKETLELASRLTVKTLYNDESSYSYSYSFQHVSPDIVGIRIGGINFIDTKTEDTNLYDDLYLVFSIKGEIKNSRNLSDMYFLTEGSDHFFNVTLDSKSDVDISKIEFVTQLCYKPSMRKSGYDYCSFVENSKNTEYAFYSNNVIFT